MKGLYLGIVLGTFLIPFVASFLPQIPFRINRTQLFKSLIYSGLFFIGWDVIFTYFEVWGFNARFHFGFKLLGLPLEEWLFFIGIPYASLYLHRSILHVHLKNGIPSRKNSKILSLILIGVATAFALYFYDRWYSVVNAVVFVIAIGVGQLKFSESLRKFYPSFLVILVPFLMVNGILTGSFLEEPIVWYNPLEFSNLRLGTIPVEDTMYAFSMLFIPWMLYEKRESFGSSY